MRQEKQIALITGATSGIGRAYAFRFAEEGYHLIVTGRRMDKLDDLSHALREHHEISVQVIKAEFSDDKDIQKLIKTIESHDNISVLVNNAGFGSGLEFFKDNLEEHIDMIKVHVLASVRLVYAVLPQMIRRKAGTIINVSSLGAFLPAPGGTVYSASKSFLASFSESLHMELHRYGIKVQCICPGLTHSDFHERREAGNFNHAGFLKWMEPEEVVDKSLRSLNHSQTIVVPGTFNKLPFRIASILPRKLYYFILERSVNVNAGPGFPDHTR